MKEEHIQQFRRLTHADLAEILAEVESATVPLGQRLVTQTQLILPGEVSHVQIDLTTLLLSGVPSALVMRPSRTADPELLDVKHLGRFGATKLLEETDSKNGKSVRVGFGSSVEAALGLLVDLPHPGAPPTPPLGKPFCSYVPDSDRL